MEKFNFGDDLNSASSIEKLNRMAEVISKVEKMRVHGATLQRTPSSYILNIPKQNAVSKSVGGSSGTSLSIMKVIANEGGAGTYRCMPQILDATDWNNTTAAKLNPQATYWAVGQSYIVGQYIYTDYVNYATYVCKVAHTGAADKQPGTGDGLNYWTWVGYDDAGILDYVYNLGENGLNTHQLIAGDVLVCWQTTDDEGNSRWVGFSPEYAWWKA